MIDSANLQFGEPVSSSEWKTEEGDGIYAILRKNSGSKSRRCKDLEFGESGNLSDSNLVSVDSRMDYWTREADSESELSVATSPMPASTSGLRQTFVTFLFKCYRPISDA